MNSDDITTESISGGNSDGSESVDEGVAALRARVRDLEADVYGYSNDEESAGQEAVVDVKRTILFLSNRQESDDTVPIEDIWAITALLGLSQAVAEQAFEKLRRQGEIYEPISGEVRTT